MNRSRSSTTIPALNKTSKKVKDISTTNMSINSPKRPHFDDITLLETLNGSEDKSGKNSLLQDDFILLPDPIPPLPETYNLRSSNSNGSKIYNTRKRTSEHSSTAVVETRTSEDPSVSLSAPLSSNQNISNSLSGRKPVIPGFVNKLYRMVDDESTSSLIKWSSDGRTFLVLSPEDFSRQVLPLFFKHNNFSSFVRQLNMYGFHKVPHLQQGSMAAASLAVNGIETTIWEFSHENFLQGRPDLLIHVRRKILKEEDSNAAASGTVLGTPGSTPSASSTSTVGVDSKSLDAIQNLRQDLLMIRHQQASLRNDLLSIQRDNQLLWNETLASRDRHLQQQQVIDRILRFLATVFTIDGKVIGNTGSHQNNIQLQNLQNIQSLQNLNSLSSMMSTGPGSNPASTKVQNLNLRKGGGGPLLIEDVPAILSDLFINEIPENPDIRRQVMELIDTTTSTTPPLSSSSGTSTTIPDISNTSSSSYIGVIPDDPSMLTQLDDVHSTINEIDADIAHLEDHLQDQVTADDKLKDVDFDFSNYLNCNSLE